MASTISGTIGPVPIWYIADLVGRPLGGGYMATFSNLNPTIQNPVYQDEACEFPWPYVQIPNVGSLGILFNENGSQGPFYWKFDTANPSLLYYIEVYDHNGVPQWTVDNYIPGGGGGGSVITETSNFINLIQNNIFYRNIGTSATPLPTQLVLAPSAHAGLCSTSLQTYSAGPDIQFLKNTASLPATDQIVFNEFTLGTNPLNTGTLPDITPVFYLTYSCTNTPTGETTKLIQFPITSDVQNLNGQQISFSIWAKFDSGSSPQITASIRQFFGDGSGASPDHIQLLDTFTLSNAWARYTVTAIIDSAATKNIGACGNDGVFLQIELPLDEPCQIDLTLPALYLGSIIPPNSYLTNDMVETLDNSARTGDIRQSLNTFYPYGWVPLNDGTIGAPLSGATTRKNIDTFPLYHLIWNTMSSIQTYAPMYNSSGAVVSYGASSVADFTANNALSLTKQLNRVLAGGYPLPAPTPQTFTADFSTQLLTITSASPTTEPIGTGVPVYLSNSGGALPAGLSSGTIYYAIYVSATTMKLALTAQNAFANTPLSPGFTDNGTGTQSIVPFNTAAGNLVGSDQLYLSVAQLPPHTHTGGLQLLSPSGQSASGTPNRVNNINTGSTGDGAPVPMYQPTTYMNFYMKL